MYNIIVATREVRAWRQLLCISADGVHCATGVFQIRKNNSDNVHKIYSNMIE